MGENSFRRYSKPVLISVGLFLTLLSIAITALRLHVRRKGRAAVGLDDWFIVFATLLCIGAGAILVLRALGQRGEMESKGGLAPSTELANFQKCRFAMEVLSTFNLGIIKASVLLFYRRLFTVRLFAIANSIMLGIVAASTVAFISAMFAQCTPLRDVWDTFGPDSARHCLDFFKLYQAVAFSDVILDALVLVCPIPVVILLHLPWRKKIAVIDILLLGSVVLGSGIARAVAFQQVVNFTVKSPQTFVVSSTYYSAGPVFWTFAENAVAIVGACLPTLAPLWNKKTPRKLSTSDWSYHLKPFSERKKSHGSPGMEGSYHPSVMAKYGSDSYLVIAAPPPVSATKIYAEHTGHHQGPRDAIHVQTTLSAKHSQLANRPSSSQTTL